MCVETSPLAHFEGEDSQMSGKVSGFIEPLINILSTFVEKKILCNSVANNVCSEIAEDNINLFSERVSTRRTRLANRLF